MEYPIVLSQHGSKDGILAEWPPLWTVWQHCRNNTVGCTGLVLSLSLCRWSPFPEPTPVDGKWW